MGGLRATIADAKVSRTHGFLWILHCKHKLLRIYTQNIDALESKMGIPLVEVPGHKFIQGGYVPLHGTLTQLRCGICSTTRFFGKAFQKSFQTGEVPDCPGCIAEGGSIAITWNQNVLME
jgi:NAD-dependent histone deacetylase SIR2